MGDILIPALGCRTGLPAYVAWRAGSTTLCRSQLYPPQSGTMNLITGLLQLWHWQSDALTGQLNLIQILHDDAV
jgi:hypothetical protein